MRLPLVFLHLTGLLFALTFLPAIAPTVTGQALSKDPLVAAAITFNASCPRMVDRDTRLDSAVYIPVDTFRFDYTLVNYSAHQVNAEALAGYLRPRIIANVSKNAEMKIQRDQRIIMVFLYRDRSGELVTQIELGPGDYLF